MKLKTFTLAITLGVSLCAVTAARAEELEITHWWTSGGEAAAVAVMAEAFNKSGNKWADGAIAGSSGAAIPIIISRITGGDPMGATQLNHGKQAEELIQAGLLQDLTEVATRDNWKGLINPPQLLESCTFEGKVYCAPVNIHSPQWLWLSNAAFKKAGLAVPANWSEFVAAAPALEKAGIVPLAMGNQPWQTTLAFDDILVAVAGVDLRNKVLKDKDATAANSPEIAKVFEAMAVARDMSKKSTVQDWNQATNMVITGQAAGQIMGDWAQGEFKVAGQVAGTDYTCLPGLGLKEVLSTGGDAFYFPKLKDASKTKAQLDLASLLVSKDVQVNFNLKKGSLPIRSDIDMGAANDCMKKGLAILAKGGVMQGLPQILTPDVTGQIDDLTIQFWKDPSMTPEAAQKRFVEIITSAN